MRARRAIKKAQAISGATRSGRRYLNPALPANVEEAKQQMSDGPLDPAALQVQIDALQAQLQQRDADLAAAQQAQQLLTQQLAQAQQQQAPQVPQAPQHQQQQQQQQAGQHRQA
uniref:Uncharacterized protein n=1 Tax=Chromera velia CCMP2878 TaxID=1169474 RepID=A0A0G4F588_9ALVE|eukprot:Cvel_15225.t1-p1 / transcript=Cvel_15225.t1 / gene=Cvel_15225 / organism=Chromera_velia_CCMP2878 / gene_product=hypothetical protein / transcript_product=hypothetical protein / location=Cvel_scaffold1114:10866-11645(-) / protein_length=113 / sequence_SO=supercontig / SO=protein_coding / is_pseudo=false